MRTAEATPDEDSRPARAQGWWPAAAPGAEAVAAAQFLLAGIAWIITSDTRDDYDVSGFALGWIGFCCCLPVAPAVLGVVHALLLTKPAALLARAARHRTGLRRAYGEPAALLLLSAVPAALLACLGGVPYAYGWAAVAGSGTLPLLVGEWFRRRGTPERTRWARVGVGAAGASAVLFTVGVLGPGTFGFLAPYEPPLLGRDAYAGRWSGYGGAAVELRPDGRAVATRLRYQGVELEERSCSGAGTWTYRSAASGNGAEFPRREGVDLDIAGCPDVEALSVAGTRAEPEVYYVAGDPDGGGLFVLRRG
ncbi:hypothetical protein LG634_22430 [Streptomyces bambusae]|uniref:hypothetical protein n=1 Tax=Streptomyces bambusae TaxID=1550616 RepID=UPI001CFE7AA6|nr:hypothetical protein [Streptomyces bambusae]MCB5167573.1 hypothetical protein [Streptomyces bambusae]